MKPWGLLLLAALIAGCVAPTVACKDGEIRMATCDNGLEYLNENCVEGEWVQVKYIRNPCEAVIGDITSFDECVAAGYPVMESYPRQCRTPDGPTFTEIIDGPIDGAEGADSIEWVENSITQPLPSTASKTRLGLPALPEDLMPDGAPITGFGAHIGQHIEGLDHSWIGLKKGVPAKSWGEGVVTGVVENSPGEYFIYVDFGDGLHCAYGEIGKPLVTSGQKVKHLDPIGEPRDMGGFDAGEIESYCADANRHDGTISSAGWHDYRAVSPFDYLNDEAKAALVALYQEKVLDAYMEGADFREMWHPSNPYLTNKIKLHEENSITGVWFLQDREWNLEDASIMVFIESDNPYYKGNVMRMRFESADMESGAYIDGTYEITYTGEGRGSVEMVDEKGGNRVLYALFEITEGAGVDVTGAKRAQMKFEMDTVPVTKFSDKALTYQERGAYNPRYDAWKLGLLRYQ